MALQATWGVRLRGVPAGQHTAPGAAGGDLRARRPVARGHSVHAAPWRDGGGAGDHAEFGPG